MKVIQKLSDRIEEEIHDADFYATWALEVRDEDSVLAETLFALSVGEMDHMGKLHEQVVRLIEKYRKEHGEPPAEMLARYEYLHNRHIEAAKKVRVYQAMFRER